MKSLVDFAEKLRRASNDSTSSLANQRALSLRQLRRICSRTTEAAQDVGHQISRAILLKFVPRTIAQDVETLMEQCGVPLPPATADFFSMDVPEIISTETTLTIGDTTVDVPPAELPELIPKTLFYENALHCHVLREMLRDMEVFNERAILLMGNQGVGKNKLADKLLMLMHREREYLQLHRDTTVQSLTTAPSLEGGVVQWNDSPLVRAVVGLPRRYMTFPFLMVQGACCCFATPLGVLRVEGVRSDGAERLLRLLACAVAQRHSSRL